MFFAGYLVSVRDVLSLAGRKVLGFTFPRGRDLGPILIAWLVSLAVIFEKDLGSSLLFFGVFVAMLYVATERVSWIAIGLALPFAGGAYLAYRMFDHVQQRVELWLDPFSQASIEQSDQLAKGIMGMASGGLFGTGLGRAGLAGGLLQQRLHLRQLRRGAQAVRRRGPAGPVCGLRRARSAHRPRGADGFGKLLAFGLAFSVGLQVFVVIGGVTKVIPLTGLTTPFMSLGGSSLLANWALMAILLRISDQARRPVSRATRFPSPRSRRRTRPKWWRCRERALRRVSTVVALLFAALFISTTLIQVIFAPSINARPDNRRTLLDNYSRQRGAILVGDQAVAVSQPTPNEEIKYLRTYPKPLPYSHVTGCFSYTYGAGGGLEIGRRPAVRIVELAVLHARHRPPHRETTGRCDDPDDGQPQGAGRRRQGPGQPARRRRRAGRRPARSSP